MAGRKPDYRLVYVEENKGRKTYFRIGAAWKNTNGDAQSVGIEINVGLPLTLAPHTKLVLFENTEKENESDETEFPSAA